MNRVPFENIIIKNGLIRGPFGSDMKKSLFVPKGEDTVQVFTQQNVFDEDENTAYYFISKDYFNKMSRFEIKNDDFLITCDGTLGKILHVKKLTSKSVINSSLLIIRLDTTIINPDYFYYYWKYHLANVLPLRNVNSCLKHLPSLDVVKAEMIDLPSLPVQKRIGEFLANFDSKIKNNDEIIKNLLEKMMSIYRRWFEEFEFPIGNGTYKSSKSKMKHCDEFDIDIPESWSIESLMDSTLCEVIKPGINDFLDTKCYFSTSEINGLDYDTTVNLITYENRESRANMQPVEHSIWFAKMKNSVKHIAFCEQEKLINEVILSTGFTGLKCTSYSFEYLFCLINSSWFESQKDLIASGSTQESVTETTLAYINMIVPPKPVLVKFSEETSDLLKLIYSLKYQNEQIKKETQSIVPAILNGTLIIE